MLRVYQSTNASDAKKYYTEALAKQDYYVRDQELGACWGGKAAEVLGLSGPVTQEAFARLCENRHPGTGEKLTPRTRDDRTVGYDLSFHAPKGVSLLHALTGDQRIVKAMERAVHETMQELESSTHTRVRLGGKSEDRHTGNLIWGAFTHYTTRPVEGKPDPQLHVHGFVFNATHDPVEQRWKAAQFRQIVRDHPYFQAGFHSRLAANLEAIGYPVARMAKDWDLAGITRSTIEKFSRRTQEIEEAARRLGITDPAEKGSLGARTRSKKDQSKSATDLQHEWQQRLSEVEAEWLHRLIQEPGLRAEQGHGNGSGGVARGKVTAKEALDHAIGHVFARTAVESDRRIAAEALKYALGDVSHTDLWAEINSRPELLFRSEQGERWMTTRSVLEEERYVLEFAVSGKGMSVPLGAGRGGREGDRYEIGSLAAKHGLKLNGPQTAAVEHLLSSRDRVMLLRGGAGTGKTTLLSEAALAIRHGGKEVFAVAVTTDASRGVLREAGFRGAETLQKLLTDRKLQDQVKDQVIWVDEAGMVGTPTLKRLFELAGRQNARVVLAGDIKQHAPVERGDAMGLLERQAGIRPAEVDQIIRQSGIYKQAVESISRGDLVECVKHLDQMGSLQEIRDPEDPERRHRELAERYLAAVSKGQSALVVSPTHAEGKEVTRLIREALKESGRISKEEKQFSRLADLQWTDAQKADPHNYELGQVVQFTQHCPGSTRLGIAPAPAGLKARVVGVDAAKGVVTLEDAGGHRRPAPLQLADRFGVYRSEPLALAVGDTIRITRHSSTLDNRHRLYNGSNYRIVGFTEDGHIRLNNKWVVSKHVGHLNHGCCVTPQAAQGRSVDVCLAAIAAGSLTASTLEQLYVILSRAKKRVELLTDKRSAFIDAVARVTPNRSATELLSEPATPTRQQRLVAFAKEVQRLRAFEQARWEHRKWEWGRQQRERARQQDRQQSRQPDRKRGNRDRGGPVKER